MVDYVEISPDLEGQLDAEIRNYREPHFSITVEDGQHGRSRGHILVARLPDILCEPDMAEFTRRQSVAHIDPGDYIVLQMRYDIGIDTWIAFTEGHPQPDLAVRAHLARNLVDTLSSKLTEERPRAVVKTQGAYDEAFCQRMGVRTPEFQIEAAFRLDLVYRVADIELQDHDPFSQFFDENPFADYIDTLQIQRLWTPSIVSCEEVHIPYA